MNERAGRTAKGISTLRATNGEMVRSSKEEREWLIKPYRKLGTTKTNNRFDMEINMWADANGEEESEREVSS